MKHTFLMNMLLLLSLTSVEALAMEDDALDAGMQSVLRQRIPFPVTLEKSDGDEVLEEEPAQESPGRSTQKARVKKIPLRVQAVRVGKDVLALLARATFKIIGFKVPFVKPCLDAVFEDDEDETDGRTVRKQMQVSLGAEPSADQNPGLFRRAWDWCCQKTEFVWRYFGGQRSEAVCETPDN